MIASMRKAKAKETDVVTRSVILTKEVDEKLLAIADRDEPPTYLGNCEGRQGIRRKG